MSDREQIVRTVYARWNRSEGDLALDLFDPEVEIHQMGKLFDSEGTFHGHQGARALGDEADLRLRPDQVTHVWCLRDGLVTEFSVYETKEAALRAVQLREPPESG